MVSRIPPVRRTPTYSSSKSIKDTEKLFNNASSRYTLVNQVIDRAKVIERNKFNSIDETNMPSVIQAMTNLADRI